MDNDPMTIRLRLLAPLAVAALAAGCGLTSGPAPASLPNPATAATVVLYRVHLGEPADDFVNHNVYLDGVWVGRLDAQEDLLLKVAPGVHELSVRPELKLLGSARGEPLKYSLQLTPGSTRHMRYRTAVGQARMDVATGSVYADRELGPASEQDYAARR
jgi:hypothetical protein